MNSNAEVFVTVMAAGLVLVGLGVGIAFLLELQRAVERCAPANRALSPGQVWLNLIPLFNIVWQFILISRVSETLSREFASRGRPADRAQDDYGRGVGIATCILGIVSFIPYLGILTSLASVVCWIVYWVKIAGYSRALAQGGPFLFEAGAQPVSFYPPARESVSLGLQTGLALILAFGYGASILQRFGPSIAMPAIRADLHITTAEYGMIFTVFPIGMMVGYVLMTVLTVLWGARWGLAVSFAGMSLAAFAPGFLPSYGGLLASRFLMGLFTAGLLPGAVQSARDWFPATGRPLVIGAVLAAGAAASLLAAQILTFAALSVGWKTVLSLTGLPTLVAAALCLAVWPKAPSREPFAGFSKSAFAACGMIAAGLLFASPVSVAATTWLPVYLRSLGLGGGAYSTAASAVPMGNLLGALLAGLIAWAVMMGSTRPARVRALLLTVFGCLLPVMALAGLGNRPVILTASILSALGYSAWSALLYSAVSDAFPAKGVAAGAAVGGLAALIGGMAGPPLLGVVAEARGYPTVFVVAGATAAVGAAIVLLLAWFGAAKQTA